MNINHSISGTNNQYPANLPSLSRLSKTLVVALSFFARVQNPERTKIFHPNLTDICSPGLITTFKGDAGCLFNDFLVQSECEQAIENLKPFLESEYPDLYHKLVILAQNPDSDNSIYDYSRGYAFRLEKGDVFLGLNPEKKNSCQNGYDFAEIRILNNPNLFQSSVEEILNVFKETHSLLTGYELDSHGGELRTRDVVVTPEGVNKNKENMVEHFLEKGGKQKDAKRLASALHKISLDQKLSPKEWSLIKILSPAGVPVEDISVEMTRFIEEFKEKMGNIKEQDETFVLETAAWVHQEIIRIHPFNDGNGHTARLWMNIVLKQGGVSPVFFANEDDYVAASDAGIRNRDHQEFISLLKQMIFLNEAVSKVDS